MSACHWTSTYLALARYPEMKGFSTPTGDERRTVGRVSLEQRPPSTFGLE